MIISEVPEKWLRNSRWWWMSRLTCTAIRGCISLISSFWTTLHRTWAKLGGWVCWAALHLNDSTFILNGHTNQQSGGAALHWKTTLDVWMLQDRTWVLDCGASRKKGRPMGEMKYRICTAMFFSVRDWPKTAALCMETSVRMGEVSGSDERVSLDLVKLLLKDKMGTFVGFWKTKWESFGNACGWNR